MRFGSPFRRVARAGLALGLGLLSSAPVAAQSRLDESRIVREIEDPSTGRHWFVVRNVQHPEGPGLLVPVAGPFLRRTARTAAFTLLLGNSPTPIPKPEVRAGDRLILEEHTAVLDARLEAVALTPARTGEPLRVRLTLGGHVVRARLLHAGLAEWMDEGEGRP